MSYREVGRATALPHTTVADYVRRARVAGLGWPLPDGMDDDGLDRALFSRPEAPPGPKALPDWATVHLELKRNKAVTLMLLWDEYRALHPDGYAYSQFNELYRRWKATIDVVMRQDHKAGERLFVDFPGMTIPV